MAREPLDALPDTIAVGETVSWYTDPAEFPTTESWSLTYSFRGPTSLTVTCTVSGSQYLATITAAAANDLQRGTYWWDQWAAKGTGGTLERYRVASGQLAVVDRLAVETGPYDGRTHAQRVLAAIEDTILGKASRDQSTLTLGGIQIGRLAPEQLTKWRTLYKGEVAAELAAARVERGESSHQNVGVRFTEA